MTDQEAKDLEAARDWLLDHLLSTRLTPALARFRAEARMEAEQEPKP